MDAGGESCVVYILPPEWQWKLLIFSTGSCEILVYFCTSVGVNFWFLTEVDEFFAAQYCWCHLLLESPHFSRKMGRGVPLSWNFQVLKTVPVLKAALCPQTPVCCCCCKPSTPAHYALCKGPSYDSRVDSILELKVYQAYYNAVNIGIFSLTKGLKVRVGGRKLRTA